MSAVPNKPTNTTAKPTCHGCGKRFTKAQSVVNVVVSVKKGRIYDGTRRRAEYHAGCFPIHINGMDPLPTFTMGDLGLDREEKTNEL